MGTGQAPGIDSNAEDAKKRILERYDQRIAYYWKASKYNKRYYKMTRFLLIILGAAVTLISSLTSAISIKGPLAVLPAITTPILAACLAIVGGFSQAFQWGAAWSDQVLTAMRLEKGRDRISVTPAIQLDPIKEMQILDETVMSETEGFFQRLFGSGGPSKDTSSTKP
jgi:hypothetical protein